MAYLHGRQSSLQERVVPGQFREDYQGSFGFHLIPLSHAEALGGCVGYLEGQGRGSGWPQVTEISSKTTDEKRVYVCMTHARIHLGGHTCLEKVSDLVGGRQGEGCQGQCQLTLTACS